MASRRVHPFPSNTDGCFRGVYAVTNCSRDVDGKFTTEPHEGGVTRYLFLSVYIPNSVPSGGKLKTSPSNADPDPRSHVHIVPDNYREFENKKSFYGAIGEEMRTTGSNEIRILTPGFRSTLPKYARIAAKMARDMDFVGPILLYIWGAGKNLEYIPAQDQWLTSSTPPLVQILRDILKEYLPNAKIGMIGHSLGCRLLTNGLTSYMEDITHEIFDVEDNDVSRRLIIRESLTKIPQIVLAASDQSMEEFRALYRLLKNSAFVLPTLTVYCSRDDLALAVSKILHPLDSESRLGRTHGCQSSIQENRLNLNDGMSDFVDIVDTTGLYESKANHSYYYRSSRVLNDMKKVFNGERARDRDSIHSGYVHRNGTIYAFIPAALQASSWRVALNFVIHWEWSSIYS